MATLRISLLGSPRIRAEGYPAITTLGPKSMGLIAYLATAPALRAERSALANLLWSEARSTSAARHALRQCLVRIRSQLGASGSVFHADDTAVWLADDQVFVDVGEILSVLESGSDNAVVATSGRVRGRFCSGLESGTEEFELWLRAKRSEYDRLCASLHGRAADILADLGRAADAIAAARRRLEHEPFDDAAHAALISICIHFGRRQDAVLAHAECTELFQAELGIAPGAEVDEALSKPLGVRKPAARVIHSQQMRSARPFASFGGLAVLSGLAVAVFQTLDDGPAVAPKGIESKAMPVWVSPASPALEVQPHALGSRGHIRGNTQRTILRMPLETPDFGLLYPVGC